MTEQYGYPTMPYKFFQPLQTSYLLVLLAMEARYEFIISWISVGDGKPKRLPPALLVSDAGMKVRTNGPRSMNGRTRIRSHITALVQNASRPVRTKVRRSLLFSSARSIESCTSCSKREIDASSFIASNSVAGYAPDGVWRHVSNSLLCVQPHLPLD